MTSIPLQRICDLVSGRLSGSGAIEIVGVEQVDDAGPGELTFIGSNAYATRWATSKATAAIVQDDIELEPGDGRALLHVPNADLAMAMVLELFAPPSVSPPAGIHPRAVVDPTATIGDGVAIGAQCYVGPRAVIGDGAVLHPNVTVLEASTIGAGCILWPGVVICARCTLGDGCQLHPNVSIGADGFGYRPSADGRGLVKIPQIGTVRIGRDVEIGANSCVDRAKFSATVIGDGTKIDNLCQIGHNCVIGRCVIIAATAGVAGSVTIGDGAIIGGGAMIKDHVTIGPGAQLGGHATLMRDIPAGARWTGIPAKEVGTAFKEYAAIRKLPELLREFNSLRGGA